MLAHAPFLMASSLIQSASYPRSASSIAPDCRRDRSFPASRTSWASPGLSASRTGRPLLSTTAWILLVKPPRDLPIDLALVPFDAGSMLMHADNGGVDHLDSVIMGSSKCVYDAAPDTSPPPAGEPVVASGVWAKRRRQITPGCS